MPIFIKLLPLVTLASLWLPGLASADRYTSILMEEHGEIEVLTPTELSPLPEPGPGEVRVRVLTASASFTDIMVRRGIYPLDADLPYAPGYDLVGVVDKLGAGVTTVHLGQRVADLTIWGAYSEYTLHRAERLVPVPDGIGSEEAVALILSYTTAYQMLYRVAQIRPQQRVLIHGASGAVGTALAQLGRVSGLTMYGTASAAKADYVRSMGVTPIDYRSEDFVARIMAETNGEGVDVVFDAIGVDNFKRSYQVLAPGGELMTYGYYRASRNSADSPFDILAEVIRWQWQSLLWNWFPEQERHAEFYSITDMRDEHPEWFSEDLISLFKLLQEGNIRPTIWKTMPLEQAAQAHRYIENGEVVGKIVLKVAD